MPKKNVLFVCTHNSARSQMAEGWLRALAGTRYEVFSAGTEARGVNPLATRAMAEVGIDISSQYSKVAAELADETMDIVVTVCDAARESCPYVPAREQVIHRRFDDPSAAAGSDEERMEVFRRVRDEIKAWLDATLVQQPAA